MSIVCVASDSMLALALALAPALALLIFGDAIYCIQAIKQQEVTNCASALQKYNRSRMGTGRRSGEQRNQATSGHELKKKMRSRTGKGINSREFAGAWICVAGVETRRWRPASRDGGSSLASGSVGSSPVAGERDYGATRRGCGARHTGVRGCAGMEACGDSAAEGEIPESRRERGKMKCT